MTAPLRSRQSIRGHIRVLLNGRAREFDKVPSAINLADRFIPGVAERLSQSLYRSAQLPFAQSHMYLLSYGLGATVFFLHTPAGDKVLKIFRRSLGTGAKRGFKILNEYKTKYEMIASWYRCDPQIVPDAQFLMLNGPVLEHPVGAVLQTYVPGEQRDLFTDFSSQELVELIRSDVSLRKQFCLFASRTLALFDEDRVLIDLVGSKNVALVQHNNTWRLKLMDGGVLDLRAIRQNRAALYAETQKRVAMLRELSLGTCGVEFSE
jgi:hypothetical protein